MCCTFKVLSFFHVVIQFPTMDNPQSFIKKMTANSLFTSRRLYIQYMYMYKYIKWLLNKFLYYILKLKKYIHTWKSFKLKRKTDFQTKFNFGFLLFYLFFYFFFLQIVGYIFYDESMMMNPYHTCTFLYITFNWGDLNMESTMPHAMIKKK